ncbi:DUF3631 domain-containing protein [Nonomuraea sp. K274]|uniref:DUF3631 domain-containing protein n=1 Tax=Nonomuraea cypriaca TaxID=1187855 RepID=A0A931F0T0_9ACTN|nr:DUF3631 domain-containing protein [Nonomuraea cypriaca]
MRAFIRRFCIFPSPAAYDAVTLWAAHTHLIDAFESTPRLAFLSPEPGSGKTRALEILELLVPNPMLAVNATPAALFRSVADPALRRTVLFDEIDTIFGPKAKDNEELRGLLNAGHRRSGVAYRCVGEGTNQAVVAFPAYAAVAMGGLGNLPDTILTRSVIIHMRRRAPGEQIEPYRERRHGREGRKIGTACADWAKTVADALADAWPEMPEGITDRPADVWEPLLAIADAAGGTWPDRARAACLELARQGVQRGVSLGIRLLADLRFIFDGARALFTEDILTALWDLENAPWSDLRGRPLDARGLARLLDQYEVAPTKVKINGKALMGYRADDLADPWARYLPAPAAPAGSPEPPEPAEPGRSEAPTWVPETFGVPEPGALETEPRPDSGHLMCPRCGQPMDPALTTAGMLAHPGCLTAQVPATGAGVPEPGASPEPFPPALTCEVPEVPEVPDFSDGTQGPPAAASAA